MNLINSAEVSSELSLGYKKIVARITFNPVTMSSSVMKSTYRECHFDKKELKRLMLEQIRRNLYSLVMADIDRALKEAGV